MSYVLNLEQIPSEQFSFQKDRLALLNRGDIHEISGGSIGSVDLTKVVGATHPNYGGLDWGTLKPVEDRDQCYLSRSKDILSNLKKTPEYYLSQEKKQGWAFLKIGDEYYIDEGVHRTVLARLFLSANQLPQVIHGVTITEAIWKDKVKAEIGSQDNEPAISKNGEALAKGNEGTTYIGKALTYMRNILGLTEASDRSSCVNDGLHIGSILYVADGVVVQKINRNGDSVQHDASKLSSSVMVGDVVEIAYKDGVGVVRGPGMSVEVGR